MIGVWLVPGQLALQVLSFGAIVADPADSPSAAAADSPSADRLPGPPSVGGAGLTTFVDHAPRCDPAVAHCFGIVLHMVQVDGVPLQTPRWVSEQVAAANRLFAPIGAAFEVAAVRPEHPRHARLDTRRDRDVLGRGRHDPGVVHLWVVARLGDVDQPGQEIRGVHWRDRADRTRRFVVLSAIAGPLTLAHELGHFFGLPHGRDPASIMNKQPRVDPPPELRGFVAQELRRMARTQAAMLADKTLVPRKPNGENSARR